jgi:transposase
VGSRKRPVAGGRPKRRTFTAAYKLSIVEAYDQLSDPGERGALLRREGLYHSHIQKWREARDQGALEGGTAGTGRRVIAGPPARTALGM